MLWQGAKRRILKNFNVQNEECHNYVCKCEVIKGKRKRDELKLLLFKFYFKNAKL
jgi:hypothetical protein